MIKAAAQEGANSSPAADTRADRSVICDMNQRGSNERLTANSPISTRKYSFPVRNSVAGPGEHPSAKTQYISATRRSALKRPDA
jgi:hypothetical protein